VRGDEKRLRQVFLNLLGNAVKFTEHGSVTFGVGAETTLDGLVRLRLEVADTGPGISEDKREEIFQPFQQGLAGSVRQVEGTGLGLAISRDLLGLMGGELSLVRSGPEGSLFRVDLQLPAVDSIRAAVTYGDRNPIGYEGDVRNILVVDDKATNRAVLVDILSPLGFELSEAEDGAVALDAAYHLKPDLILLDLVMPELDGFEVTRRIRASDAEIRDVPIIAVSASVYEEHRHQCTDAGCTDFLPKPVPQDDLPAKLQHYLGIEWIYEEEAEVAETAAGDAGELVFPDPSELGALYRAARDGQIVAVRSELQRLGSMGEEFAPLVDQLQGLAGAFNLDGIAAAIESRVEPDATG
jgi:CheY-like chemotaxis protein